MVLPSINEACGRYFKYSDLLHCSDTWQSTNVLNLPVQHKTYQAMESLCQVILEPVVDEFGPIKLTHGFCSKALERKIQGRITPRLDQHAGYELSKTGCLICPRGGFAADFVVQGVGSLSVAKWIAKNTAFDRLYFYGDSRPIHVSAGPDNLRLVCVMRTISGTKNRIPRVVKVTDFLALRDE